MSHLDKFEIYTRNALALAEVVDPENVYVTSLVCARLLR